MKRGNHAERRRIEDDGHRSCTKFLVQNALTEALKRDPVDAANDAGLLAIVLDKRAAEMIAALSAQAAIQQASKR